MHLKVRKQIKKGSNYRQPELYDDYSDSVDNYPESDDYSESIDNYQESEEYLITEHISRLNIATNKDNVSSIIIGFMLDNEKKDLLN